MISCHFVNLYTYLKVALSSRDRQNKCAKTRSRQLASQPGYMGLILLIEVES